MKLDRISSLVFFLIGVLMIRESQMLPYMVGHTPGPGFFPLWLGIALVVLSAVLFITTRSAEMPFLENRFGFRKTVFLVALLAAYVFSLSYLGLLLALGAFLAILLRVIEGKGWRTSVSIAVLTSVGCYLLFEVSLKVPLPSGILGI